MSFYDNSSLAFLPSSGAGKDGKAYSIKPTDGTGDFTFSRGSNLAATRVGPTGLIEKGRENLILQSNQFDTTPWLLNTTSATSGQSGYDGTTDAWFLNSTGTGFPRVQQNVATSGVFVFSVYAKAATDGFMLIRTFGADAQVWFDLSDGSISNEAGAQYISSTIENIGNGWYRYSVLVNGSLTSVRIYPASAYGVYSTSGNGIYIQDSQVEVGTLATEVIESGATTGKAGLLENEPRFDYSGGATCPSLLLEPSRTNLVTQSEYINSGGGWSYSGGLTTEVNSIDSPEGLTNGTKVVIGSNQYGELRSPSISQSATTSVISLFAKAGDLGWCIVQYNDSAVSNYVRVWFNISTGAVGSNVQVGWSIVGTPTIEDYGSGWYRCNIVLTTTATSTNRVVVFGATGDSSFGATENSYLYAYGLQLESGSYPTSYIPNHSGGTITRGGDNCFTNNNSLLEQTSATYFLEVTPIEIISNNLIEVRGNGSSNNRIILQTTAGGDIRVLVRTQGSSILDQNVNSAVSRNTKVKVALKYTPSNISFFVDGVKKIDTDVSVDFSPELNGLDLEGSQTANDDALKQHQFLFFPEALSDADCITLTT